MKHFLISPTKEVNCILWDGVSPYPVGAGWLLLNEVDFATWRADNPPPPPRPEPVPEAVGPAQLRIALRRLHNIKPNDVLALIAAIEDVDKEAEAEILWEYAAEIKRTHPLVLSFGSAFSLTAEQIDEVFRQAAQI